MIQSLLRAYHKILRMACENGFAFIDSVLPIMTESISKLDSLQKLQSANLFYKFLTKAYATLFNQMYAVVCGVSSMIWR